MKQSSEVREIDIFHVSMSYLMQTKIVYINT